MKREYKFDLGERIALIILLIGLPGLLIGFTAFCNMIGTGVEYLNVPKWAWLVYGVSCLVIIASSVLLRKWIGLLAIVGLPFCLPLFGMAAHQGVTADMAQSTLPVEALVANLLEIAMWGLGLLLPVMAGLITAGFAVHRILSKHAAITV